MLAMHGRLAGRVGSVPPVLQGPSWLIWASMLAVTLLSWSFGQTLHPLTGPLTLTQLLQGQRCRERPSRSCGWGWGP